MLRALFCLLIFFKLNILMGPSCGFNDENSLKPIMEMWKRILLGTELSIRGGFHRVLHRVLAPHPSFSPSCFSCLPLPCFLSLHQSLPAFFLLFFPLPASFSNLLPFPLSLPYRSQPKFPIY